MKKTVCFLLLMFLMCFMAACGNSKMSDESNNTSENAETVLQIKVGEQVFPITLYDNPSTQAFVKLLPLDLDMSEMNGNEKYFFLSDTLPTESENVGNIREGDFMLYGNNCLVLFYKSFSTSYSYTPLGCIDNPDGFAEALGSGDVQVTFQME